MSRRREPRFTGWLSQVAPEVLDKALSRFIEQNRSPHGAVAVDGKGTAAEWTQGKDSERVLVAAVEHGSGLVCGQEACDGAGGEILGARALLQRLDIQGRVVTLDALHTQQDGAVDRRARRVLPDDGQGQPAGTA